MTTSVRQQVKTALKDFRDRKNSLSKTVLELADIPVAPKSQPPAVTLESLLQQYAAGYLSTDQFLQCVGV